MPKTKKPSPQSEVRRLKKVVDGLRADLAGVPSHRQIHAVDDDKLLTHIKVTSALEFGSMGSPDDVEISIEVHWRDNSGSEKFTMCAASAEILAHEILAAVADGRQEMRLRDTD